LICKTVCHTKAREDATSLWKHEENADKIGINREPLNPEPNNLSYNIFRCITAYIEFIPDACPKARGA
jgi:hypothetical protein